MSAQPETHKSNSSTLKGRAAPGSPQASPWRRIFEDIRKAVGNRRDETGVLGSINWLRKQMELRGANPNVVRNIIYRDKGKLHDKRVLFEILNKLWVDVGNPPLQVPELEVLLSTGSTAEQEVMQLLGREKRRAYRTFVGGVRSQNYPKIVVTGRPGAGKTLLTDYIQQALEMPPKAAANIVRLEFSRNDLAASLTRLARALGVPNELIEARLVKIGMSSAFAVQADAQADVARVILEPLRYNTEPLVLLLHISQVVASNDQEDTLGLVPLRLNTPEVPRASTTEWLWVSLLTPLSRLPNVSLFISMVDVPARVMSNLGKFEGPIKLSPPTASEARRFVKARLPHLPPSQQEILVHRAKRSFEDLRTLTLLTEIREPLRLEDRLEEGAKHIKQLSHLVQATSDETLRGFLGALAVLSLPDFPNFSQEVLDDVRGSTEPLSSLEQAFLDIVPGESGTWRCFSRQLAHSLRDELKDSTPRHYRDLSLLASQSYEKLAQADPRSEVATRYVYHLLEARNWETLELWLRRYNVQQSLLQRIWKTAQQEELDPAVYERLALQVAAYYVKLGSHNHPDVRHSLSVLSESGREDFRAWAQLKRAESEVIRGNYDDAEVLIQNWPEVDDPTLNAEVTLVKASVARWRGHLDEAAELIDLDARQKLPTINPKSVAGELIHAKVSVWAGLIAKDKGDFLEAIEHFQNVGADDDLIQARVAFQNGDVLAKLGRFDASVLSLKEAVTLSHHSEAPVHEQVRYISRLAHLQRKVGALDGAEASFAYAHEQLNTASAKDVQRDFERAKIRDEQALNLLAKGRFDEAIFALRDNIKIFASYQTMHKVDARFRIMRSTLRLGMAYWCRGLNQPYAYPLTHAVLLPLRHPDVYHAQRLAHEVREQLADIGPHRYGAVHFQSLLVSSLLANHPNDALMYARKAHAGARFDYQRARCAAYIANAHLRQGHAQETLEVCAQGVMDFEKAIEGTQGLEHGDEGLLAWLFGLMMMAYANQKRPEAAIDILLQGLKRTRLPVHHKALLCIYGPLAEENPDTWLTLEVLSALEFDSLKEGRHVLLESSVRLPDALVTRWQEIHPPTSDKANAATETEASTFSTKPLPPAWLSAPREDSESSRTNV